MSHVSWRCWHNSWCLNFRMRALHWTFLYILIINCYLDRWAEQNDTLDPQYYVIQDDRDDFRSIEQKRRQRVYILANITMEVRLPLYGQHFIIHSWLLYNFCVMIFWQYWATFPSALVSQGWALVYNYDCAPLFCSQMRLCWDYIAWYWVEALRVAHRWCYW